MQASADVASLMRLAARPVGAASFTASPARLRTASMALSTVVLPTPGPPVTMKTAARAASSTAARCSSASVTLASRSKSGDRGVRARERTRLGARELRQARARRVSAACMRGR